jgi:hypothetical protein
MRGTYIFNNIFFRAPNVSTGVSGAGAITQYNWVSGGSFGCCPFGDNWWTDYNAYITRGSADKIVGWYSSGGVWNRYSLPEWQAAAPLINPTYPGDPHSLATADSFNVFVNRGARDYSLDAAGANYTALASGGRGGTWDTYMGAIDPSVDVCVSVVQASPANGAVVTTYSPDLIFDTYDRDGDTASYLIIAEDGDPTPDDTIEVNKVVSDGHVVFNWPGRVEDHVYYWKVKACDTSDCCYTTGVYSFTVDVVPLGDTCPTVTQVAPANGATLADYHVDIVANFLRDAQAHSVIATLIGERSDATPEDTVFIDTLVADSSNWAYNWATTSEDSTYYWQLIARDANCADTTPIQHFLVDSIPNIHSFIINGSVIRGVEVQ